MRGGNRYFYGEHGLGDKRRAYEEGIRIPSYPATQKWQSIRTRDWKWIHYPEFPGADELYDLRGDPGEMRNRISEPALAPLVARMQADLKKQLSQ